MKTAKLLKKDLKGFKGTASLYELIPVYKEKDWKDKLHTYKYVVASAVVAMDTGSPETFIFPAKKTGEVKNYGELKGSYRGGLSHRKAFKGMGYTIS